MRTFLEILKDGNEGYPFRTVLDNLADDQILECVNEFETEVRKAVVKEFTKDSADIIFPPNTWLNKARRGVINSMPCSQCGKYTNDPFTTCKHCGKSFLANKDEGIQLQIKPGMSYTERA